MTTYQRGNVTIASASEELAAGRYRGILTFSSEAGQWKFRCNRSRVTSNGAQEDAEAEVEFAYRQYLAAPISGNDIRQQLNN